MVNPAIDPEYPTWKSVHMTSIERNAPEESELTIRPLFSIIVPLFKTPIRYFHDMIGSVLAQTYANWELILVNASPEDKDLAVAIDNYQDSRIHVVNLEGNYGIAGNTNEGIRVAQGDYISFFDHDDVLDRHILAYYAKAIDDNPEIDLLYCDEDNFHDSPSDSYAPLLKPDFNLDLLYSHNYIIHMLTVSRHALNQVALSPETTNGAQDYDLTLKASEVARAIKHVPLILYHWRAHPGSTNGGVMSTKPYAIAASVEALGAHFNRRGLEVDVKPSDITCVFQAQYKCPPCSIDVVLYNLDDITRKKHTDLLHLLSRTPTIKVGNVLSTLRDFERLRSNYTLVCSKDIQVDENTSLEELCGCLSRPEVAIVAPKIFYLDGLVQHAGIAIDEQGSPQFLNQNFIAHMGGGYHGYAECSCNYSAVGPDCFLIKTELLKEHISKTLPQSYVSDSAPANIPEEPSLGFMLGLCADMRDMGYRITVLPTVTATIDAPIIWDECPPVIAYPYHPACNQQKKDELYNPNVSFISGYPQLRIARDRENAIKQMVFRSKIAHALQPIKRLLAH